MRAVDFSNKKVLFMIIIVSFLILSINLVFASSSDFIVTMVSQTPDPVEPGQTFEIKFKIENLGEETEEDIIIKILPEYPFTIYGDEEEKNIGKLRTSNSGSDAQYIEFQLKVDEGAVEGETEIELELEISEGVSLKYNSGEFVVDIETHDAILEISSVQIEPEKVSPGNEFNLEISMKNTADSLLKDIIFKLELEDDNLPFAPFQSSSERRISQLESDYQKSLSFTIISSPNANAGLYKIPINISYNDELGNSHSTDDLIAVIVGEQPELKVFIKKSEINKAGEKGKVTLTIANTDISNANYVELELVESSDYQLLSSSDYFYIGDLDSDDTESEDLEIFVHEKLDTLIIPLKITFTDDNNIEYQQNFYPELELYSKEELDLFEISNEDKNNLTYIVIILLIVGLIFYFYRKNRKNVKE